MAPVEIAQTSDGNIQYMFKQVILFRITKLLYSAGALLEADHPERQSPGQSVQQDPHLADQVQQAAEAERSLPHP